MKYLLLALFLSVLTTQAQNTKKDVESKFHKKGISFMEKQNYERAIPWLNEALIENVNDGFVNFNLGKCYYEMEQFDLAFKYLERAYQLKPNLNAELHKYFGLLLQYNNKFEEAIPVFEKAVKSAKGDMVLKKEMENRIKQCETGLALLKTKKNLKFENVGPYVNTQFAEYVPNFNKKMTTLMFTSRRPRDVEEKFTKRYLMSDVSEDIYTAKYSNGTWHKTKIEKGVAKGVHDANITANGDLKEMYLYIANKNGGDIHYSKFEGDSWSKSKPLSDKINSKHWEPSFFPFPDGKYAIFSSDRPGGKGELDLYMVKKTGKDDKTGLPIWGNPINLKKLNSKFDDDAPYFDGKNLFFASRRPESMGGYDIFKSEWNGDTSFTEPVNMGFPINSGGDDIYYFYNPDSNRAFLSSWRKGGYGSFDIYTVDLTPLPDDTDQNLADLNNLTPAQIADFKKKFCSNNSNNTNNSDTSSNNPPINTDNMDEGSIAVLAGNIYDNATSFPVGSSITITNLATNQVVKTVKSDIKNGHFAVQLPTGHKYKIAVESNGYLNYSENIILTPESKATTIAPKAYRLQKFDKSNNKIVLNWQFFDVDKAHIQADKTLELENVFVILNENSNLNLLIIGHTDSDGTNEYNKTLSLKRCNQVKEFLVKKGINADRLKVEAKGEEQPLYDNNSKFKKWNRRVELYLEEK